VRSLRSLTAWILGAACTGSCALAIVLGTGGLARADDPKVAWGALRTPAAGPARSHGGYSNGCIEGALLLPAKGTGFQVMKPERLRAFGHPRTVAFVSELGAWMDRERLGPLPVGDLSQPRGGPARGGHASHQTGLDADLWYALVTAAGKAESVQLVDHKKNRLSAEGSKLLLPRVRRILQRAASDGRVERIFVNPVIKRALCERLTPGPKRDAWLRKVRPWYGHDEHFHVRLACPSDSPGCKRQEVLPPGDGCAEIDWWLDPKAQAERAKKRQTYRSRLGGGPKPQLPARCKVVLAAAEAPATAAAPAVADGGPASAPANAGPSAATPPAAR
jgi:penicillin-insensitive murein endopeptidase